MKKILLTGADGQLGQEIRRLALQVNHTGILATDIDTLDITDEGQLDHFFRVHQPGLLINCAAYTAVDQAEDEPQLAFLLNQKAVENLLAASREYKTGLIHLSTDFVFNGQSNRPWKENDPAQPLSVYGKSKRAGEIILEEADFGMIVRTSWLYSGFGHNFVKTMLKLGKEKEELSVVNDQVGSPTWARDLAGALFVMADHLKHQPAEAIKGIYHFSNQGSCSWYEFAVSIMEMAGLKCRVKPVPSSEYPQKAKRPDYSVLDIARISERFSLQVPLWQASLQKCIEELINYN